MGDGKSIDINVPNKCMDSKKIFVADSFWVECIKTYAHVLTGHIWVENINWRGIANFLDHRSNTFFMNCPVTGHN